MPSSPQKPLEILAQALKVSSLIYTHKNLKFLRAQNLQPVSGREKVRKETEKFPDELVNHLPVSFRNIQKHFNVFLAAFKRDRHKKLSSMIHDSRNRSIQHMNKYR